MSGLDNATVQSKLVPNRYNAKSFRYEAGRLLLEPETMSGTIAVFVPTLAPVNLARASHLAHSVATLHVRFPPMRDVLRDELFLLPALQRFWVNMT